MSIKKFCYLICVFIFMFSTISFAGEQAVSIDAKLEVIEGLVRLTHLGSNADLVTEATQLRAGDVIETTSDGKAAIAYSDGTRMKIKENTQVEVQARSVRIFKGKTWYKFTKRGTEFRIETPSMVAGIKGTEFEVNVTEKDSSVSVFEGAVQVRGNASGNVLLTEGMSVTSNLDGNLSKTTNIDVKEKRSEWVMTSWKDFDSEEETEETPKVKKTIRTLSRPKKK